MDPVSGALAGASLISGITGGKSAKKKADRAAGKQSELIKMQVELFKRLKGIVEGYDAEGGFDPKMQLEQLQRDTEHYSQRDMSNAAGSARILGYRPGDSAPLKRIRSIDSKYKLGYAQAANQIRESAFGDRLSAYRAIDPTMLNNGIQTYGQQANAPQPNMGNMFGSIMPFLGGGGSSPNVNLGNMNWGAMRFK